MDPEAIYQEVLSEEQAKGSSSGVAEGRAKAARQRAVHGSPHPKEAKWWPGAQPHLEGGEAAAPADDEAPEEAAAEAPEAAPEPEPATAPTPEPAQAPAPAAQPAPEPAAAPAAAAPAAAAPAAPAAAAVAAPQPAPSGVLHGTPSGNRLRPEDGVATQAQFDGQRAMYERRKLIDELVATGVPAVAAETSSRPSAPVLAMLYILIPLAAIFILLANDEPDAGTAGAGTETAAEGEGGEGGGADADLTVISENIAFDTDTITVGGGEEVVIDFQNPDSAPHNIAVYQDQASGVAQEDPIFQGETIDGGESIVYNIPAVEAGEYYFQCDVHPNMSGAYVAE